MQPFYKTNKGQPLKQNKVFAGIYSSPVGLIGIQFDQGKLSGLEFLVGKHYSIKDENTSLVYQITDELSYYFKNPKHAFNIDFYLSGTMYQKRIWHALQEIPSGTTFTYGDLAKKLKTGARAIGQACRTNPLPIIIPCHRVVAGNSIGGYVGNIKGAFAKIKEQLLQHEQSL